MSSAIDKFRDFKLLTLSSPMRVRAGVGIELNAASSSSVAGGRKGDELVEKTLCQKKDVFPRQYGLH